MSPKKIIKELPKLAGKYKHYLDAYKADLPNRRWPNRRHEKAPIWCSVDLRDGNQALVNPMSVAQKVEMFELLVAIGFKQIEIAFPSASAIEFDFTRLLIEENRIPADVRPQFLVQAREELIEKTFQALAGAPQAIVHMYNSTSIAQREIVFRKSKKEIIDLALNGTKLIRSWADSSSTDVMFEYSPESFSSTEIDFALEICQAVAETWKATPEKKMIFNLPATVEYHTPNIHADQIEWFIDKLGPLRDSVLISLHTHNDRGTGVAATELGLLAGADRVEGTLFGNGERTGNVDLITLALNLYTQGIDPQLNLGNLPHIKKVCERLTQIPVNERHPYSGELVFTAFSGSHQDAIRKGLHSRKEDQKTIWDVPYIPIDPSDIGREYEAVVRINSQSGKGGVAFVLEEYAGFTLPKKMHPEFSRIVQKISEQTGKEVLPDMISNTFAQEYLSWQEDRHLVLKSFQPVFQNNGSDQVNCEMTLVDAGKKIQLTGHGNGPIDAAKNSISNYLNKNFKLLDYAEHALDSGSNAEAAAYISIQDDLGQVFYGVGRNTNTVTASIMAMISAINRAYYCQAADTDKTTGNPRSNEF